MFYDIFYALCKERGVTPTQVAREIDIRQSTVSMWKKQGTTPKYDTLEKLSALFGVSIDYLLGKATTTDGVTFSDGTGYGGGTGCGAGFGDGSGYGGPLPNYLTPQNITTSDDATKIKQRFLNEFSADNKGKHKFQKMSEAEAHRAGFLQFKSDEDRIAFFYSRLNIDGKLAAGRCLFKHLDPNTVSEVADYIENLSEVPQYQRQDTPEDKE